MNARAEPFRQSFGMGSNYVFGRNVDDRQRLQHQFGLLREDFNLWFDETLRLGGPTDPDEADWSVLDVGCGEGQFSREIARRYPNADVVGIDVDAAAIAAATAASADEANVRFLMRDARQLAAEGLTPEGGFDAASMWMLLMYLPDKQAALANLAATLAPGGVLLLGNVPDEPMSLDHPAVAPIMATGHQALAQLGLIGLERDIGPLLEQAGFGSVTTVTLRYPIGGATSHGHRWFGYALASISAGRRLVVDVCELMDGADYDRRAESLANTSVLDLSGEARFLVTLAKRGA